MLSYQICTPLVLMRTLPYQNLRRTRKSLGALSVKYGHPESVSRCIGYGKLDKLRRLLRFYDGISGLSLILCVYVRILLGCGLTRRCVLPVNASAFPGPILLCTQ
jgi:hypothetical protein